MATHAHAPVQDAVQQSPAVVPARPCTSTGTEYLQPFRGQVTPTRPSPTARPASPAAGMARLSLPLTRTLHNVKEQTGTAKAHQHRHTSTGTAKAHQSTGHRPGRNKCSTLSLEVAQCNMHEATAGATNTPKHQQSAILSNGPNLAE
jgi:hypothetical protein